MKHTNWVWTGIAALSLILGGCGQKSEVDAGPIKKSFRSAEPATKSTADKAVASIEGGDYPAAMDQLRQLSLQANLTQEQKEAIKEVLTQVHDKVAAGAPDPARELEKGASDLQKSVPEP